MKKSLVAVAAAALALTTAPTAGAAAGDIPVPVPFGSTAGQLPPLPAPFVWDVPAPRYVASNWVEPYTWCPAPHQRAYGQDGTTLWCSRIERTDGFMWAPTPSSFTPPAGAMNVRRSTSVANSLGAKPCGPVGATAVDPSNGQGAYCDWRRPVSDVPIWQYPIPPSARP